MKAGLPRPLIKYHRDPWQVAAGRRAWFTADTHYGHKNIMPMCQRPWTDVEDMDRALIRAWNSVVSPDDVVFHLGDVSFYPPAQTAKILSKLRGFKVLVVGNHDYKRADRCHGWDAACLSHIYQHPDGREALLQHYPYSELVNLAPGQVLFHGHSHGRAKPVVGRVDAGVDCWEYKPVSFDELWQAAWAAGMKRAIADFDDDPPEAGILS